MLKIKKALSFLFSTEYPIQDRIFYISLVGGLCASIGTLIGNLANGLKGFPIIASIVSVGLMIIVTIYTFIKRNIKISSVLISISLNFALFPVIFITSGGLYSGMILYFMMGLFITTFIDNKKIRYLMFSLSLIFYSVVIVLSCNALKDMVVPLEESQWIFDAILCMAIVSAYVFFVFNVFKSEYQKEKIRADEYNQILFEKSLKDPLTKIFNRRYFDDYIENFIKDNREKNFSIAMCDIDFFKRINDTYGHQIGDIVLKLVADKTTSVVGGEGVVARYGGEEFIILLKYASMDESFEILERIRYEIGRLKINDIKDRITISIGYTENDSISSYTEMQKKSDDMLYKAKNNGRNQVAR